MDCEALVRIAALEISAKKSMEHSHRLRNRGFSCAARLSLNGRVEVDAR